MTQPTPGFHENFAEEAAMSADKVTEAREVLFFASYCGDDNPECSEKRPCPVCLGMSNVYEISADTRIKYKRELAPHWLTDKGIEEGGKLFPASEGGAFAHPVRSAQEAVKVKPLEWNEISQARSNEDPSTEVVGWEANAGFASFYTVDLTGGGASMTDPDYEEMHFSSPDEAKAAAQADYEQRVRSALLPPGGETATPDSEGEPENG